MTVKNKINAIELTEISSAVVGASYQAINPNGLDEACFLLRIINASNQAIYISFDGVTDHDYIPASSVTQLPVQSNAQPTNWIALFAKRTVLYIRGTAGMGTIAVAGYYQGVQQ